MALPLFSSTEVFDHLRQQGIEPYTRLGDVARNQIGDGLRLLSLRAGEAFATDHPALRIAVLSGTVRLNADGPDLDIEAARDTLVRTRPGGTRLIAGTDAVIVLADMEFLDTLVAWEELARHAQQSGSTELAARFAKVRHSTAFRKLPLECVEQALTRMTPRIVKAGETIFAKGDPGDNFYLIWSGRVAVWRTGLYDEDFALVAELGPGDTFGEEALITGGTRNATIRMTEDCELLVLDQHDFRAIMSKPLVEEVPTDVAAKMIEAGWKVVDVRYPEEFEDGHIPGAIPLPLPDLRARAESLLDKENRLVTVCLSGKRSAVGAYLLNQRGFKSVSMKDGMGAWSGAIEPAAP